MRIRKNDSTQSANFEPGRPTEQKKDGKPASTATSAADNAQWRAFAAEPNGKAASTSAGSSPQRVLGGHLVTLGTTASKVEVPDRLFIGGEWVEPAGGGTFPVTNPATGEVIFQAPLGTAKDVERAVSAARATFDSGVWSNLSGEQRGAYLDAIAQKLDAQRQEFVELETLNNGKTHAEAQADIQLTIDVFKMYAEEARKLNVAVGRNEPLPDPTYKGEIYQRALGVVGAIVPWNYPLAIAAWKMGPALAAGCTMVIKPSEYTPVSLQRFAKLLEEVGLPSGVVNVVPGFGADAGAALAKSKGINRITFTGSVPTGKAIAHAAAENLIPASLELGGKSPIIICNDADLEKHLDWMVYSAFALGGQVCSLTAKFIIHEGIYDEFVQKFVARTKELRIGEGSGKGVHLGPLISERQLQRVQEYIESGKREGATLLLGGGRPKGVGKKGFYLEPTIFTDVRPDMKIVREEIFGPVVTLMKFKTDKEALALANDTEYGLAAAVFSKDEERAKRLVLGVDCGVKWVNNAQPVFPQLPWVGIKQSGVNSADLGRNAVRAYLVETPVLTYRGGPFAFPANPE